MLTLLSKENDFPCSTHILEKLIALIVVAYLAVIMLKIFAMLSVVKEESRAIEREHQKNTIIEYILQFDLALVVLLKDQQEVIATDLGAYSMTISTSIILERSR